MVGQIAMGGGLRRTKKVAWYVERFCVLACIIIKLNEATCVFIAFRVFKLRFLRKRNGSLAEQQNCES